MTEPKKLDIFRQTIIRMFIFIRQSLFLCCGVPPSCPYRLYAYCFGPVINSQIFPFFVIVILLVFALIINGILEWLRERILLSGTFFHKP